MKIYIAGKITGDPDFKEKFQAVEEKLKALGHTVMNPAVLPLGFEHHEYMNVCLAMIDVCDCVYMLPDWRDSKGACIERDYAIAKRKLITMHVDRCGIT